MKLDLDKFYNSNYKDFVHKEAVEEALRMVAEIELKDVEIDTILSITFSVDEYGENPMYVEYLDKEDKKHIVRIRPAVTNEIQEMLKRYVTLEQHENDKNDIYNHFTTLNVPMEIRSESGLNNEGNGKVTLNNDNSLITFQLDSENGDIQWLCIHNKNGEFGPCPQYMARFVDYAMADEVPSITEFLEAINGLENKIHTGDETTLQEAKDYADVQDTTQRNEILSVIDVKYDDLKSYVDSKHTEATQLVAELEENVNTNFAKVTDVTPLTTKLSNVWGGHKAPFIYWLPNIDINTMKLEDTENDVKVTLNDGDVAYWRKNPYQPVDLTNYYTKTESDSKYALKAEVAENVVTNNELNRQLENYATKTYAENQNKLYGWNTITHEWEKSDGSLTVDHDDTNITSMMYRQRTDDVGLHVDFNDFAKTSELSNVNDKIKMIETMITTMGETHPIEMNVSYNDNALELNNYSTYTTIGNTTFVNINCNFNAPFISGSTPILNKLNINSETLKSFPTFMNDCIVKTATNVSSYTTTTVFSNKITSLAVETPVIAPNETIATTLISFNGSFVFSE